MFLFWKEPAPVPLTSSSAEKVSTAEEKPIFILTEDIDFFWLMAVFKELNRRCCCLTSSRSLFATQRVLSRQEELKERARLLLEQARKDAAMKASNKNNPNSAANAANRTTNVCDVSLSDFISYCHILKESVLL